MCSPELGEHLARNPLDTIGGGHDDRVDPADSVQTEAGLHLESDVNGDWTASGTAHGQLVPRDVAGFDGVGAEDIAGHAELDVATPL